MFGQDDSAKIWECKLVKPKAYVQQYAVTVLLFIEARTDNNTCASTVECIYKL